MYMKKGFTLVEILVVITIIGIILGMSFSRMEQTRMNSNIDAVEGDLRVISLDVNNFNMDYGGFYVRNCDDDSIVSDAEYETDAREMLKFFQSYITNEVTEVSLTRDTVAGRCRIELDTVIKEDPWGNNYKFLVNLKNGTVIALSKGPDGNPGNNATNFSGYSAGEFGDDILVIIERK